MAENIELQIPLNTEASSRSSRTQNKSCMFRRKCFASFIISGGIVLAIIIAVMLLIPQDPTLSAPSDDYEDYYENDENQNSVDYDGDYDLSPQTGGYTTKAEITNFPWAVSFGQHTGSDHYCGGAIVAPNAILTAAHCFFSKKHGGYDTQTHIFLGDVNPSLAERFDIQSIIKHPLYTGHGPKHDLAIVFTKKEIQFNERKQKIVLAEGGDSRPKRAKFSAWGYENDKNQASDVLKESDLDVLEVFDCARPEYFGDSRIRSRLIEGSIFCAASAATYTCSGDSGSPLVSSNQLIGILHGSNRKKCVFSVNNTPSLFANVSYAENTNFIRNWISLGATLDYQNEPLFNYLTTSTMPNQRKRNLWATYKSAALASSINETQQYMEVQLRTTTPPPSTAIAIDQESKILIAIGNPYDDGTNTEIIDVGINSNYSCPKLMPFPVPMRVATGGLVNGQPFLCGGGYSKNPGYGYFKDCYKLENSGSWTKDDTTVLNENRGYVFGSVVLENNLIISGGWSGSNHLYTIEMLSPHTVSETLSVDLPYRISSHCQVSFSSDQFMVIGGTDGSLQKTETYVINVETNQLTNGPNLKTARAGHGCGELEVDGKSYIIISGGSNGDGTLRSTEILDKNNVGQGWQKGDDFDLPVSKSGIQMVSSPDKKTLYAIGGDGSGSNKDVYKSDCNGAIGTCKWIKSNTELTYGRSNFVAMSIPNSLADQICH